MQLIYAVNTDICKALSFSLIDEYFNSVLLDDLTAKVS